MKNISFERTITPKFQNKINISIIFNYLRNNENVTRTKISKKLNISGPAVSRVIDKLVKEEYVLETEKIKTKVGKRPIQLEINPNKGFVVSVDLAKENVKIALTNFKEDIIRTYQGFKLTKDKYKNLEKIKDDIKKVSEDFYQDNLSTGNKIEFKAISIALPASVDSLTHEVVDAPTFEEWRGLDIYNTLHREFNVPIYIENDVNLSVLGEKRYGKAKSFDNIVFIEISNGIGVGIIVNDKLLRGANGLAGEIECMSINSDDIGLNFNKRKTLSTYASFQSIKEQAIESIRQGTKTLIADIVNNDSAKINSLLVCKAAIQGDILANNIITKMVEVLAAGIINILLLLNPQIIVLGGDISDVPEIEKLYIDPIKKLIKASIPYKIPEIVLTSLGANAGVMGASFLGIESLLIGDFPYTMDLDLYS